MPRLFVAPQRLTGQTLILDGEDHRYLTRVLRLGPGEPFAIFDGEGSEIAATIVAVGRQTTEVTLSGRSSVPASRTSITLLQAIPRGERMDWLVQKTTELGVARLVPVVTRRTIVKPAEKYMGTLAGVPIPPAMVRAGQSPAAPHASARVARWRTIAEEAARQCGRADVPVVEVPRSLDEALGELGSAPASGAPGPARFILWEDDRNRPLHGALCGDERDITLLIGPEGGFETREVRQAEAAGFTVVGIGPRILRVDTAAVVAMTLAQAAVGGLG